MTTRNANRPGYKKTLVGWIPEEWEYSAISSIGTVNYGLTVNAERRGARHKLPYLTVANFTSAGLDLQSLKEIGCLPSDARKYSLQPFDVLVVEGNGSRDIVGMAILWPGISRTVLHQNHLLRIRLLQEVFVPQLLVELINSSAFRRLLERRIITSSGLHTINSKVLKSSLIPLPPLREQKKIADILSTWDEAIEQTRALIATTQRRKTGLMQQLLTGKRRSDRNVPEIRRWNTPLGLLPGDWPLKRLGEVFAKVSRKNAAGVTRVLTASGQNGLVDQRSFFNKAVAAEDISGYYLLKRGEFAYNRSAMAGYPYGAMKRLDQYEEGALSTLYSCFSLRDPACDSDFYLQLFELGMLDRQLRCITHVGGRAHGLLNVTDSDFLGVRIPVPSLAEQRAISAVLIAADEEINSLKTKRSALERQKKGLMQKLLTGEIRVKG